MYDPHETKNGMWPAQFVRSLNVKIIHTIITWTSVLTQWYDLGNVLLELITGCVSTSGGGLFFYFGGAWPLYLSMITLFYKTQCEEGGKVWSPWFNTSYGVWFARGECWPPTNVLGGPHIIRFQRGLKRSRHKNKVWVYLHLLLLFQKNGGGGRK